jgi:orotate phosphoribosyltransferase
MVMEHPGLLDEASADLVERLWDKVKFQDIDRVVGPAMGAITLAHCVARVVTRWQWEREQPCLRAYTIKATIDNREVMVFEKTMVLPGERVLLVEDAVTTFGSLRLTADAVTALGGVVLPYIGVLVNHSDRREIDGRQIVSLLNLPMPTWEPGECPLCKAGSVALRPKELDNWDWLTATYE